MRQEFNWLSSRLPSLWTNSYFISTVGGAPLSIIKQYIKKQYKSTGKAPTYFQQSKSLTLLKRKLKWLKEVDSTALQSTIRNLDTAYQNFFRRVKKGEKPGYPYFKNKHKYKQSYKSKSNSNIKILKKNTTS